MPHFDKPKYRVSKEKMIGDLTGAGIVALNQAERYGTELAIMENGKIIHVSPQEMRQRLGLSK